MPEILTQDRLDILEAHVFAGDRIAYYTQLADWGYQYGELALGVVNNDSIQGHFANRFFQIEALTEGVTLSPSELAQQGQRLMELDFALRSEIGSNSRLGLNETVENIQQYHEVAFLENGVSVNAWTPTFPLSQIEVELEGFPGVIDVVATSEARNDYWQDLLNSAFAEQSVDSFRASLEGEGLEDNLDAAAYLATLTAIGIDFGLIVANPLISISNHFGDYQFTAPNGGLVIGGDSLSNRDGLFSASLVGGSGDDVILGFDRADELFGLAGDDRLYGGDGDDTLDGGSGFNLIYGGSGEDVITISEGVTGGFIDGGENGVLDVVFSIFGSNPAIDTLTVDTFVGSNIVNTSTGFEAGTISFVDFNGQQISIDYVNIEQVFISGVDVTPSTNPSDIVPTFDIEEIQSPLDIPGFLLEHGPAFIDLLLEITDLLPPTVIEFDGSETQNATPEGVDLFPVLEDIFGFNLNDDLDDGSFFPITFGDALEAIFDGLSQSRTVENFVVSFGPGISPDDVGHEQVGDDLEFSFANGSKLTIEGIYADGNADEITSVVFAGGTSLDLSDISGPIVLPEIIGTASNNNLVATAAAEIIDGLAGNDFVDYRGSTSGVDIDLAAGTASGGFAEGDILTSIERIRGSNSEDELTGDDGINLLFGQNGDDIIDGGAGNDRLRGGNGEDQLDGGAGVDIVDYLDSTSGVTVNLTNQTASGGFAEGDTLSNFERAYGSQQGDTLIGSAAANLLSGYGGIDNISGLSGNDFLIGGGGNDILDGGAGHDRLRGGVGEDELDGGTGLDIADYLDSTSGVTVNLANGTATGGFAEGDTLTNIERLFGSRFDDELTGDSGNNLLYGFDGIDTINGGAGNDRLRGGEGADELHGGTGGNDSVDYLDSTAGVTVNLASQTASGGYADGDTLTSIESIFGSKHVDILTGSSSANILRGFAGDDIIDGGTGNNIIDGGTGNDTFIISAGSNSIIRDYADGDMIDLSGLENESFDTFAEIMAASSQSGTSVVLDFGNTTVTLGNTSISDLDTGDFEGLTIPLTFIRGTSGNDILVGGDGPQHISGLGGHDRLYGGDGDDILVGAFGNDRFEGGAGDDMIFSNGGFDTFVFSTGDGHDMIYDFDPYEDMLDLGGAFGGGDLNIAEQVGNDVVFDFGGGDIITLVGLDIGDIINLEDFEVFV